MRIHKSGCSWLSLLVFNPPQEAVERLDRRKSAEWRRTRERLDCSLKRNKKQLGKLQDTRSRRCQGHRACWCSMLLRSCGALGPQKVCRAGLCTSL